MTGLFDTLETLSDAFIAVMWIYLGVRYSRGYELRWHKREES